VDFIGIKAWRMAGARAFARAAFRISTFTAAGVPDARPDSS